MLFVVGPCCCLWLLLFVVVPRCCVWLPPLAWASGSSRFHLVHHPCSCGVQLNRGDFITVTTSPFPLPCVSRTNATVDWMEDLTEVRCRQPGAAVVGRWFEMPGAKQDLGTGRGLLALASCTMSPH